MALVQGQPNINLFKGFIWMCESFLYTTFSF